MEEGEEAQVQCGIPQAQDPTASQGAKVPADQVTSHRKRWSGLGAERVISLINVVEASRVT